MFFFLGQFGVMAIVEKMGCVCLLLGGGIEKDE